MSGGHFDSYLSSAIEQLETELQWEGGRYKKATQQMLKKCLRKLREGQVCLTRVDYLFSGDDGEESFIERTKEELKEVANKPEIEMGVPSCENCKYNGEKTLRWKNQIVFHENPGDDYVATGCQKTEDFWPNDGIHCWAYKHKDDWE